MGGELGGEAEGGRRQERQRKQKRLIYSNVMQLKLPPSPAPLPPPLPSRHPLVSTCTQQYEREKSKNRENK